MSADFLRYSCQIALPDFGSNGQQKLQEAKVLLIGAGGLGTPAAQYLAAAGIGTLGIADFDTVSLSNLHRQVLYTPDDLGKPKAVVLARRLREQNPACCVIAITDQIVTGNILPLLESYQIIVDCTDNFETRYLVSDACVLAGKPLVYGAIYQYEGQAAVFNIPRKNGSPGIHYRDLFPAVQASGIPDCTEGGVLPAIAGIIGCVQAGEVIKWITRIGDLLSDRLFLFDIRTMESRLLDTGNLVSKPVTTLPQTVALPVISVAELQIGIRLGTLELVDVRSLEERAIFSIGGRHIPLPEIEETASVAEKNYPLVFYCESGRRSAEAVRRVQKKFPGKTVYSLKGGLKAWKEMLPGTNPR